MSGPQVRHGRQPKYLNAVYKHVHPIFAFQFVIKRFWKRNLTLDQVFGFIMKKCVKWRREIEWDWEENVEDMEIMNHGMDGRYLTLDQVLVLQWCEFYLENNLKLDQVPLFLLKCFIFLICFYLFISRPNTN